MYKNYDYMTGEKKRIVMYVYNDITTDARVQRAANALSVGYEVLLISNQKGKKVVDSNYMNIFVGGKRKGLLGIIESIWSAIKIIKSQNPDLVYCHDYYSSILAFYLLKIHYSGKIVYDAHELMIPEKGQKDRRLNFFYWFEKRIVKNVDLLICASKERGQIMKEHYCLSAEPVVVPNISQLQVNDDDKDVRSILHSLKDFFADTKPTVVYAGVVTNSRHIGELVDIAIDLHNWCKLLIVGNGDDLDALKAKAAAHPELIAAFTGAVPYKCLGSVLSRCDMGFLYYPINTLNNIYCASNKIYEYASVGLPMVANDNPTIKRLFGESQIGLSTSDLKSGILSISSEIAWYKNNCLEFTLNNQWTSEANLLLHKIKEIV